MTDLKTAVAAAVLLFSAFVQAGECFRNPVGKGETPDPFVVWDAPTGYYYLLYTSVTEVEIRRAKTLAALRDGERSVAYRASEKAVICGDIWAPEMHLASNGKWYVYTSGRVSPADPWWKKRLFILESKTRDPFDGFIFRGIPDERLNAIDPTVFSISDGVRYVCYSEITRTSRGQVLVVREMKNPWTFGPRRAEISRPELKWELDRNLVNEGPFFICDASGRKSLLVYSGNGCFNDDYSLGVIEFTGGEVFASESWKKRPDPLLVKGNGMYGPGHASFFRSPDGKEMWCAYHAFRRSNPSQKPVPRYLNFQRVRFGRDGFPVMGEAVGTKPQPHPSGE